MKGAAHFFVSEKFLIYREVVLMKKKILVMIAAIAAVLVLPLAANAASVSDLTFDKETGTITGCNESAAGELVIPAEIDGVKVTSIDSGAFDDCRGLTSISIPDSVTSIGYNAFCDCGSLNINVDDNNKNYCDIDGVLFTKDKKTLMVYAKDEIQPQYIIPDGVTSIGDEAFGFCRSLTSVSIPDGVTSIGDGAFGWCESLTSVSIPDSVTSISCC